MKFTAGAENAVNGSETYASDAFDPDSIPNNQYEAEDDYKCAPFQASKGPGLPSKLLLNGLNGPQIKSLMASMLSGLTP